MKKTALKLFLSIVMALGLIVLIVSAHALLTKDFTYVNSFLYFFGKSEEKLWEEEWQKEKETYPAVNFGLWTYHLNNGFIRHFLLKQMDWGDGDRVIKQEFHIFLTYENGEIVLGDIPNGTIREYIINYIYEPARNLAGQDKIPPIIYQETNVRTISVGESVWKKLNWSNAGTIVNVIGPIVLLVAIIWFLRWFMSRGKVKLPSPYKTNITFADIEAPLGVLKIAKEITIVAKYPYVFLLNGGGIPHGFLFTGPPGTGKTVAAAALANLLSEKGVLCYKISCTALLQDTFGDPGAAASRISHFFKQARSKKEPCLLIFDEAHLLFEKNDLCIAASQLLNELSGLEEYDAAAYKEKKLERTVAVLAITNKREVINEAFLRSGRINEIIEFSMPDSATRKAILTIHAKGKNIPQDKKEEWLDWLAQNTDKFSGADLEAVLKEAANSCTRRGISLIEKQGIDIKEMQDKNPESFKKILAGYPMEFSDLEIAHKKVLEQKQKAVS